MSAAGQQADFTQQMPGGPDESNDFVETPMPHGEIVVVIARGVGLLVAIVAILCAFLLMMLMRFDDDTLFIKHTH